MLRIGITGGIGSGKTTVAAVFELLGVPVYYADQAAKQMMEEDPALKSAIISEFGEACYDNGRLNRSHLSSIAFGNPEVTRRLNELIHPLTISDSARWMKMHESEGKFYCLKEAALIFESGSNKDLDYVIGVDSPEELRIERAIKRDNVKQEQIRLRMSRQMNEKEKMDRCDFTIINDEKRLLIPQVLLLHEKFLSLATAE
jgi:dephospho-CoA kinase